jgi:hypothetical protein
MFLIFQAQKVSQALRGAAKVRAAKVRAAKVSAANWINCPAGCLLNAALHSLHSLLSCSTEERWNGYQERKEGTNQKNHSGTGHALTSAAQQSAMAVKCVLLLPQSQVQDAGQTHSNKCALQLTQ